ncbi:MAG TPA: putative toxin-antitoxin system toxin component, PIN family [Usitatibacter sp.]|nr:putative toxin-antitoxin system toxin component, PIN family [Usitatibacter sp.]
MKVVFDSNVYVSAFAIPGGVAQQALEAAMEGAFELALSRPILAEVLGVLARKFARDPDEVSRAALLLSSLAEFVAPSRRVQVLADEPDNRVLECASAAGADVIVTGDRQMLALGTWEEIEILSLRQFVDRLGPRHGVHQPRARYRVSQPRKRQRRPRVSATPPDRSAPRP